MNKITQSAVREIVKDFANEIRKRTIRSAKPSKAVINFRNDLVDGFERDVVKVPIGLLRYRKDNGRIASDVLDYDTNVGHLDEKDDEAQEQIRKFLVRKDPEKTSVLSSNILHSGQRDPAIITADGFLINGNRRKMVMDDLQDKNLDNEKFGFMKVVILPGENEEGGPPTLLEIEKLENRYQLQSEGKSEYYGFDRALSIRRKIGIGLSLKEQIKDDPQYAGASESEIESAVKQHQKDFLRPLECVDRYLDQFQRKGQYNTISAGRADPEGRWQAILDYSNTYHRYFSNLNYLTDKDIEEGEIGDIEEAAFYMIRLRSIPDMPKVHTIMRNLHKYCSTKEGKKGIMKIAQDVEPILPNDERFDENNKPLSAKDIDAKWAAKNKESIIFHTKRASKSYESQKEKETPLTLLDAAYNKLIHKDMDLRNLKVTDYEVARKKAAEIGKKAQEVETEIYHQIKKVKKLVIKKK